MNTLTRRSLAVANMHLVDRMTLFVMPLAIASASLVINLVIWHFVAEDGRSTGGGVSLHFFVFAAAIFAVVRGLPFALGMGASRRAFVVGTAITGGVLAAVMGTIWAVMRQIEESTGGWGQHGHFFDFPWLHRSSALVVWLMAALSVAACFALGALFAGFWARFGIQGMVVAGPVLVLGLGGLVVLVAARHWWGEVWSWFGDQTPLSASGWLVVAIVVLNAATWAALRRVRAA